MTEAVTDTAKKFRNKPNYLEREDVREDPHAPVVYSSMSAFNVPASVRDSDPDYSYTFIPYIVGGKNQEDIIWDAVNLRGFEFVRASQCPQLARRYVLDPFGHKDDDDLIKIKGQILMKRPKETTLKEVEHFAERQAHQNYMRNLQTNANHNLRMVVDERDSHAVKGNSNFPNRPHTMSIGVR